MANATVHADTLRILFERAMREIAPNVKTELSRTDEEKYVALEVTQAGPRSARFRIMLHNAEVDARPVTETMTGSQTYGFLTALRDLRALEEELL